MLIGWLLALVAVVGLGVSFAGSFADSSSIPGSPAQTARTPLLHTVRGVGYTLREQDDT
jgi:RND superfamily putative drug exporter